MRIKNLRSVDIEFTDLNNPLEGLSRFIIPAGAEKLVFNEDAEKSAQLAVHINNGWVQVISYEEPHTTPQQEKGDSDPIAMTPGVFGGGPSDQYTFPTNVRIDEDLTVVGTLVATSIVETTAPIKEYQRFYISDPAQHIYNLAHTPIENSEEVYLNGQRLWNGVSKDYIVDDYRIVINLDWSLTNRDYLDVKYLRLV